MSQIIQISRVSLLVALTVVVTVVGGCSGNSTPETNPDPDSNANTGEEPSGDESTNSEPPPSVEPEQPPVELTVQEFHDADESNDTATLSGNVLEVTGIVSQFYTLSSPEGVMLLVMLAEPDGEKQSLQPVHSFRLADKQAWKKVGTRGRITLRGKERWTFAPWEIASVEGEPTPELTVAEYYEQYKDKDTANAPFVVLKGKVANYDENLSFGNWVTPVQITDDSGKVIPVHPYSISVERELERLAPDTEVLMYGKPLNDTPLFDDTRTLGMTDGRRVDTVNR